MTTKVSSSADSQRTSNEFETSLPSAPPADRVSATAGRALQNQALVRKWETDAPPFGSKKFRAGDSIPDDHENREDESIDPLDPLESILQEEGSDCFSSSFSSSSRDFSSPLPQARPEFNLRFIFPKDPFVQTGVQTGRWEEQEGRKDPSAEQERAEQQPPVLSSVANPATVQDTPPKTSVSSFGQPAQPLERKPEEKAQELEMAESRTESIAKPAQSPGSPKTHRLGGGASDKTDSSIPNVEASAERKPSLGTPTKMQDALLYECFNFPIEMIDLALQGSYPDKALLKQNGGQAKFERALFARRAQLYPSLVLIVPKELVFLESEIPALPNEGLRNQAWEIRNEKLKASRALYANPAHAKRHRTAVKKYRETHPDRARATQQKSKERRKARKKQSDSCDSE